MVDECGKTQCRRTKELSVTCSVRLIRLFRLSFVTASRQKNNSFADERPYPTSWIRPIVSANLQLEPFKQRLAGQYVGG